MRELLDISTILFILSLLGIILMIYLKFFELRTGKELLISKISSNTNHIVHDYFVKVKKFISYFNRKTALALIQWIAYHILSWVREMYIKLRKLAHMHPPSKKVLDMVRGKGEVNMNKGSSIYLKMISSEGDKKDLENK